MKRKNFKEIQIRFHVYPVGLLLLLFIFMLPLCHKTPKVCLKTHRMFSKQETLNQQCLNGNYCKNSSMIVKECSTTTPAKTVMTEYHSQMLLGSLKKKSE